MSALRVVTSELIDNDQIEQAKELDAENLPRRLSKDAAKLQGLTEERDKYRAAFYKLLTITSVNAHLAAELREILAFDAEVAELLQKKRVS